MRIIAGKARGRRLATLGPTSDIRPTLDRVREALFNILGPRIEAGRFLDLFAGSGANGIEALSRGADHVCFVDKDPRALRLIEANLRTTGLAENARVIRLTLPDGVSRIPDPPYDIVFADPPYAFDQWPETLDALGRYGCVAQGGLVVLEHAIRSGAPHSVDGFELVRTTTYGDSALAFYDALKTDAPSDAP